KKNTKNSKDKEKEKDNLKAEFEKEEVRDKRKKILDGIEKINDINLINFPEGFIFDKQNPGHTKEELEKNSLKFKLVFIETYGLDSNLNEDEIKELRAYGINNLKLPKEYVDKFFTEDQKKQVYLSKFQEHYKNLAVKISGEKSTENNKEKEDKQKNYKIDDFKLINKFSYESTFKSDIDQIKLMKAKLALIYFYGIDSDLDSKEKEKLCKLIEEEITDKTQLQIIKDRFGFTDSKSKTYLDVVKKLSWSWRWSEIIKRFAFSLIAFIAIATVIVVITVENKNSYKSYGDVQYSYRTFRVDGLEWIADNIKKPIIQNAVTKKKSNSFKNKIEEKESLGYIVTLDSTTKDSSYIYTWNSAKKVCPTGYDLPSASDFKSLLGSINIIKVLGSEQKDIVKSETSDILELDTISLLDSTINNEYLVKAKQVFDYLIPKQFHLKQIKSKVKEVSTKADYTENIIAELPGFMDLSQIVIEKKTIAVTDSLGNVTQKTVTTPPVIPDTTNLNGKYVGFWTKNEDGDGALVFEVNFETASISMVRKRKNNFYSVRCVKQLSN
ncbi:MAG: hypothetical protein HUJ59_05505, partial [Bacilli bacterium]|nr:hypothetical protein [Bacilli bacterium]